MKHWKNLLIIGLLAIAGLTQAEEMQVSMVAYKDCHPDLNQLDFMNKPQVCNMSSQAITFMIKGQNIAVIVKDSLKFSKLEVAGKDVRFNRKGEDAFELGSFPKIDDNGEFAIFDVSFKSAPFGHIGSASLDGTIDIITSERLLSEEKNDLDLTKGFSSKIGPFTVSNHPTPKKQPEGALNKAGAALAEGLQTAFIGGNEDSLSIYVKGDLDAFVELVAYENGQPLKPGWSSWNDGEKMLSLAQPTGSTISLKLKYWDGLERVTVPISVTH